MATFIGRFGSAVVHGSDQFPYYACRHGRDGSLVVRNQWVFCVYFPCLSLNLRSQEMLDQIRGVSGSSGRGFDSMREAQEWVDHFVTAAYPVLLPEMKRMVALYEQQLADALSRMSSM